MPVHVPAPTPPTNACPKCGAEGVVHLPTHLAAEWPPGTLVRIEPEQVDRLVVSRPRGEEEGLA